MPQTPYSSLSPYLNTNQTSWYLDIIDFRKIDKFSTDVELTLGPEYVNRPDLLAYDLYGTSKLWWVFSVRNPDAIKDPIYDMVEGKTIFVTEKTTLFGILNASG